LINLGSLPNFEHNQKVQTMTNQVIGSHFLIDRKNVEELRYVAYLFNCSTTKVIEAMIAVECDERRKVYDWLLQHGEEKTTPAVLWFE
jgi:hypothetical protein